MSEDSNGPNKETLRFLKGMMPSLINGIRANQIGGKGKKIAPPTRPRKVCTVCCKLFDYASAPSDTELKSEVCESCQEILNDGYIALIQGNRYAFFKSESMKDKAGQILHINQRTMDEIAKRHAVKNRDSTETAE